MDDVSPTTTYNIRFSELKERVNEFHPSVSVNIFFEIKVAYQKDVNQKWAIRAVQIKPTPSKENRFLRGNRDRSIYREIGTDLFTATSLKICLGFLELFFLIGKVS